MERIRTQQHFFPITNTIKEQQKHINNQPIQQKNKSRERGVRTSPNKKSSKTNLKQDSNIKQNKRPPQGSIPTNR